MSNSELAVRIGEESGDRVVIEVLARMHPEHTDFWDGNWLVSPIQISVGAFTGTVRAGLRSDELRDFRQQLERLHADMRGEASLSTMEGWITVQITVTALGQLTVVGSVVDEPGLGNRLSFTLEGLDLSFVPEMVRSLHLIEVAYPVLGG